MPYPYSTDTKNINTFSERDGFLLLCVISEVKMCRLLDFEVFDDSKEQQPLERVKHHKGALWISGEANIHARRLLGLYRTGQCPP